jgi:hypothetical protein
MSPMTDQTLGAVVQAAIEIRDQLKAGGMAGADLDRGLEAVLRDSWPKPTDRTEPWHDGCSNCRDYGIEMGHCLGDATCGRRKTHGAHEYGKPCWCPLGRKFHDKLVPTDDDAMTLAARPKKLTRWGR